MTILYRYMPFDKVEEQSDGSVIVTGPLIDSLPDNDGQRFDQAWMDAEIPEWMQVSANVREQHDIKKAAGVGVHLHRSDTGRYTLTGAIVDPITAKKCLPVKDDQGNIIRPAVLKGWSVGVKDHHLTFGDPTAPNGVVDGGKVVEVSAVDRPANPRSIFQLVKTEGNGEPELVENPHLIELPDDPTPSPIPANARVGEDDDEDEDFDGDPPEGVAKADQPDLFKFVSVTRRPAHTATGVAMPNGDFPIPDRGHLTAALGLLSGYKGDKAAARAHIRSRAKALGVDVDLSDGDGDGDKADRVSMPLATMADLVKSWDEALHPRGHGGTWIAKLGAGTRDAVERARIRTGGKGKGTTTIAAGRDLVEHSDLAHLSAMHRNADEVRHRGLTNDRAIQDVRTRASRKDFKGLTAGEVETLHRSLREHGDIGHITPGPGDRVDQSGKVWRRFVDSEGVAHHEYPAGSIAGSADPHHDPQMVRNFGYHRRVADDVARNVGQSPATAQKADVPDPTPVTTGEDFTDVEQADIIKAAVAEVNKAWEGRFAAVEAQLAKALAAPAPGGPVMTRTPEQVAEARNRDAADARRHADELLAKAAAVGASDFKLADGLRELARETLAKVDS